MNDFFVNQLRIDVEKRIGFKIVSTTEAKNFIKILEGNSFEGISLSTIRRFWGLIPMRKPNVATLDLFAKFLGYVSFNHYTREKNKFRKWFLNIEIQKLKLKEVLDTQDFNFLSEILPHESQFVYISLFEHALHHEKWRYIEDLFDENKITFLNEEKTFSNLRTSIAAIIWVTLSEKSDSLYEKNIYNLLSINSFKSYVVYFYIDIMNINGRYGQILNAIKEQPISKEENLFISLMQGLGMFLKNGKNIPTVIYPNIEELHKFPEVLVGRYYGYQILCAKQENNIELQQSIWYTLLSLIDKSVSRYYLHEFIHMLLLVKDFEKLDYILENFLEDILDYHHFYTFLDVFIFNVIDVLVCFKNNDLRRAKVVFNNLQPESLIYGYYSDFYKIFYSIVGFHLTEGPVEKIAYQSQYHSLVRPAQFDLFDQAYLETYFD